MNWEKAAVSSVSPERREVQDKRWMVRSEHESLNSAGNVTLVDGGNCWMLCKDGRWSEGFLLPVAAAAATVMNTCL